MSAQSAAACCCSQDDFAEELMVRGELVSRAGDHVSDRRHVSMRLWESKRAFAARVNVRNGHRRRPCVAGVEQVENESEDIRGRVEGLNWLTARRGQPSEDGRSRAASGRPSASRP